jgi:hypothetical protein
MSGSDLFGMLLCAPYGVNLQRMLTGIFGNNRVRCLTQPTVHFSFSCAAEFATFSINSSSKATRIKQDIRVCHALLSFAGNLANALWFMFPGPHQYQQTKMDPNFRL